MQLLTNSSEEGSEKGLCWIDPILLNLNLIKTLGHTSNRLEPNIIKKNNPILKT